MWTLSKIYYNLSLKESYNTDQKINLVDQHFLTADYFACQVKHNSTSTGSLSLQINHCRIICCHSVYKPVESGQVLALLESHLTA